ncbi:putative bifunctional diguanylate cyclase/phosphodiesterase [Burkholderia ubonensis]|uniref:putative bifunctional diguanylate cyclase/phosphodiesterase n=1 Tax=Burkholderia ubonensis TaxID=101571 RepID=UPI0018E04A93|nr:EAL domain-containing protein [Burkholderia ubonensis]
MTSRPPLAHRGVPAVRRTARRLTLPAALRNGELLTYFQPLVSVDGQLKGCEALARWRLPDGTFASPADFIAAAERTGFIHLLGETVLREALTQLPRFEAAGLGSLFMSVNISPRQLEHPDFEGVLTRVLAETGVAPGRLSLEVTEGVAVTDLPRATAMLTRIAGTGVRISLDDYGTGYAGLTYLRLFPVSTLKLDRSFIQDLESDRITRILVKAVVRLADELGLRTIAEGVETPSQASAVKELCFDYIQGYLYGKPMPADELIARFAPPSTLIH